MAATYDIMHVVPVDANVGVFGAATAGVVVVAGGAVVVVEVEV